MSVLDKAPLTGVPKPTMVTVIGSSALYGSGSDVDIMAYWDCSVTSVEDALEDAGWQPDSEGYTLPMTEFRSFRHGDFNLLVMHSPKHYHVKLAGFKACEYLASVGLLPQELKGLRVDLHERIRETYAAL